MNKAPMDTAKLREDLKREVLRLMDIYRGLSESLRPSPSDKVKPPLGERWQDQFIFDGVAENSYVLDLGCGNGELLSRLIKHKGATGQGV